MASKFKKINSLILLTAIILSFVVSFIPQRVDALDWYNTSWLYRKSITVNGTTSGVQTNYQLPIIINYGSGTDGAVTIGNMVYGNVYLNAKCSANFTDLRFTKSDGITLLDYWIRNYTASANATVWVEFDYIVASPSQQTFYVYYGNSSASCVSNGTNTFIFFDDFERGSNGDAVGGSWAVTLGSALISTDHNSTPLTSTGVAGTRSVKAVGSAGSVSFGLSGLTFTGRAIFGKEWKEAATSTSYFGQAGTSTGSSTQPYVLSSGRIKYYTGAVTDAGYYTQNDTWVTFGESDLTTTTFDYWYQNTRIVNNAAQWINAYTNGVLLFGNNAVGVGNDTYYDDIFICKFINTPPVIADWGSEEYFAVGSYLAIQNVKVFESYRQSGDWIFTIRYLNLYPPYYDTYDIRKLFVFQLRDLTGTVRSQAPLIAWGNRVGNLYMAASEVGSLDYGENYVIRIYGLFGSNPYVDYTLQDSDWQGSDLTNLDSWVVSSASVISDYYSTDLTSYNAQRGEVLNATGATIFDQGINGLSKVRPDIFESSSGQGGYTDKTHTQTGRVNDWATAVGPDFAAWFGNIGGIVGQDGLFAIRLICIIFFFVIQMYCCIPNHNIAANVLGVPFIAGLWYFGLEIIWVAMLAIIAAGLFALQFWIHK